jgi:large subunit ribosomal protein L27e
LAVLLLQVVNYNHIMPTRYTLDVDLKGVVSGEVIDDSSKKTDANKVRSSRW